MRDGGKRLRGYGLIGKRLRSYVLTCFHRLRTFAFQNPNVSKNGDKRNGDTGSSRKTV